MYIARDFPRIIFLLVTNGMLLDRPMIERLKAQRNTVPVARAHVEAWSSHDFDKARRSLAADVHVTATTTHPIMAATNLTGIDTYMDGLIKFAQPVVPGSASVIASVGDERNALLMVTVKEALGEKLDGRENLGIGAKGVVVANSHVTQSRTTARKVFFPCLRSRVKSFGHSSKHLPPLRTWRAKHPRL